MKVSIITPCKNSHEALRRIIKYKDNAMRSKWIEWIVVDHASEPALRLDEKPLCNVKIVRTEDKSPWILATLCNMGAHVARGKFLAFWGIDSFPSLYWLRAAYKAQNEYAVFKRRQAMLDADGNLDVLDGHGFKSSRNWVSRKLFNEIGGFDTDFDGVCYEDSFFALKYQDVRKNAKIYTGPDIYCFPEKGDERRPLFLHEEPKPDIDKAEIRKLANSKLVRFQLEEIH